MKNIKRITAIVLAAALMVCASFSLASCGDDGKYINKCFTQYGLSIMDKTPYMSFFTARRKEIISWLSVHQNEVESFVIIDDMQDGWGNLSSRVVNTNLYGYGLEEVHVKKAIELLKERVQAKECI